jgi:hypothetical protein
MNDEWVLEAVVPRVTYKSLTVLRRPLEDATDNLFSL